MDANAGGYITLTVSGTIDSGGSGSGYVILFAGDDVTMIGLITTDGGSVDVDAVHLLVLRGKPTAVARIDFALGMAGHACHNMHFVALAHPLLTVFVGTDSWGIDFGRKIVTEE